MPGPDCPSAADLKAYLLGDLAEPASRLVADHLGMCADCEAAARQLDAVTDPLIYSLRRVFSSDEAGGPMATPGRPVAGPPRLGAFDLGAYAGPAPERPGAVPDPARLGPRRVRNRLSGRGHAPWPRCRPQGTPSRGPGEPRPAPALSPRSPGCSRARASQHRARL